MELTAFSDRGIGTRERLEDYAADRIVTTAGGLQLQLAMVCDGAGGGEAGELAARLTSRTIFEYLEISPETSVPKLLIKAVEQANKAVYSELRGTGTSTVALAAVHLNDGSPYGRLYIANVGNSRIYLMRAGHIARLNIDHTLANEYVFAGQMSFEEAKQLDDPEYVTRAIGIGAQVSVDIGFYAERGRDFVNSRRAFRIGQKGMELQEGDTVFAASDGLFPFVHDDEFLNHALDDDVERATRTLLKYAADRGPEDNTALSMLFVPSHSRKMVQTGPRLSRAQRTGIGVFLLAVLLLIGFLGLQVASGENQRVAFLATQTLVQQLIIRSSYTPTPTPLPPTATPTLAIIVGQVGSRYSLSQSGLPVFTGRYIDPLNPEGINYLGIAGPNALSQGRAINQANLYLQPSTSIRLNQVVDDPGSERIDMLLGRGGEIFANLGDYQHGGISIALEQNPDIQLESQSACIAAKQISADPTKLDDTDKVALACYGGGTCSYHFAGAAPESVATGQQVLLDVDSQTLVSTAPISQSDADVYRDTVWQLSQKPDQLNCLNSWLDEDKDGINYPLDECPVDYGSVAAHGCPDDDNDGVQNSIDQCPADVGPESNNGCPLPDVDGDGLGGQQDACPFDPGPASNDGCPTEGVVATQYAVTQAAMLNRPTATPSPTTTMTPSITPTRTPAPTTTPTPTATPILLPEALDDAYSTMGGQPLYIGGPGVLVNDTLNNAVLNAATGSTAQGGAYNLSSNGGFSYTPANNYFGPDSFTYTLTNSAGSDSATVNINVLEPPPQVPKADFTLSPASGTEPLTVSFDASISTGPINTYTWNFGDGVGTGSGQTATYIYNTTGTYNVTLTVVGPGGTSSMIHTVTVNAAPPVACFTPTTITIATGGTVNFDASCSTGTITSYSWNFGDSSTGSGKTTSHIYTNSGATPITRTVTLTLNGGATTTGTVTINPTPAVACFNPTTITIATGGTVNFDASCSTGATSYSWNFGDGSPAGTGPTPSHTYTNPGTTSLVRTVTLTINGGGPTATGTVTVTPLIACFTPTNVTITTGGTVNFNAGCSNGTITTYSWNFGDGSPAGTGVTTTHTYTNAGTTLITRTVTLTVVGSGSSDTFTSTVTIRPTGPVAVNDTGGAYQVTMGGTLTIAAPGVLSNDTLNAGTITNNTNPTKGVLNFNRTDGSFTYAPNTGAAGPDTFTYTLTNAGGATTASTATVTICINPLAAADGYATTLNTALTIPGPGLGLNDLAPLPPTTTITFTPPTQAGSTVTVTTAGANTGGFTYTPAAGFTGTDTFTYTLTVGGCSATATVTIMVMTTNTAPVANADAYTASAGIPLTIAAPGVLTNDTDPEGNTLTAALVTNTPAAAGTVTLSSNGSFVYTPAAAFTGVTTFTYRASDGSLNSPAATVTITVNADTAPVANADTYNTALNTTLSVPAATGVLVNDTDADGNALTAVLVTPPATGTFNLNADGSFTYTPTAAGAATFTYHANDGALNSADVTVTINVSSDTAPVAVADTYTTAEDVPLSVAAPGVLANDTDAESNPLTAAVVTGPTNGAVTLNPDGSFTYTPNADYNGTDSFTYQANDGLINSNTVTVTLTITAVNDPPIANSDAYGTPFNTPRTVAAAAGVLVNDTDAEGNPLTAILVGGPATAAGGTVALNTDGSFTYIPPVAFFGIDFFVYHANDGTSNSPDVTVTFNVGFNTPPTAVNDTFSTPINTALNIAAPGILSNDTDVDGDPLTVAAPLPTTTTAGGTLAVNTDGSFTYTPPAAFSGADTFTYTATDGIGVSGAATVTINVGINTPPTANDDAYTTPASTTLTVPAPGVLGNDTDLDGDPLTAVLVPASGPNNGTLTLNLDGSFTYVPNTGFSGTDTFSYQANDGAANSAAATVSIGVGAPPVVPRAVAVKIPDPPPATRCTDTNFENPGAIRSHFTNDIDRAELYCRLIASGGSYMYWFGSPITNAGNVGSQNVLDLGLVGAVDVFSIKDVTGFVGDVDICLKGNGYMIYMNANGQPRVPQLWSSWTTNAFPGYTCTTLYAPGTVILVANKP